MALLRRGAWVGALAFAAATLTLAPRVARGCTPWAEAALAWDLGKDLVVVGIWPERERLPPERGRPGPGGFELRRISTGELVGAHDCQLKPNVPCDHQAALAAAIPAGVTWRTRGSRPPRTLKLEHRRREGRREIALLGGRGGRQPVLWLQVQADNEPERREYRLALFDGTASEALLAFEIRARGGNCPNTLVRVLRVPRADLERPDRPGRQAELLAHPARLDERFEHWRTIADLGPIPAARLLEALQAAEREEQYAIGADWFRRTVKLVSAEERRRLAEAVAASQELYFIKQQIAGDLD